MCGCKNSRVKGQMTTPLYLIKFRSHAIFFTNVVYCSAGLTGDGAVWCHRNGSWCMDQGVLSGPESVLCDVYRSNAGRLLTGIYKSHIPHIIYLHDSS